MKQQQLARNLAFFSLGLGFAELLAPRKLARLIGISEDHETTLRLLGLREIASGLGIMQGNPAYFLWSRVAGDAMDLGLLGAAYRSEDSDRSRLNLAIGAVAGVAILDVIASALHTRSPADPSWRDDRPMSTRGGLALEDHGFEDESQWRARRSERIATDEATEDDLATGSCGCGAATDEVGNQSGSTSSPSYAGSGGSPDRDQPRGRAVEAGQPGGVSGR